MGKPLLRAASFGAMALIAACGGGDEGGLDPVEYNGVPTCGAENFQNLLGRNEAVLAEANLPKPTRILHPEDAISLDFSPDRLTVDIDEQGRISSVTCR